MPEGRRAGTGASPGPALAGRVRKLGAYGLDAGVMAVTRRLIKALVSQVIEKRVQQRVEFGVRAGGSEFAGD